MITKNLDLPNKVGLGLRSCHYSYIEEEKPKVPWFEVLADNYLCMDSPSFAHLEKIRVDYPITIHCVGMSLGSCSPLNIAYLHNLKELILRVEPLLISDHLSWSALEQQHFHELLPLPFTEETILHVVKRIRTVQDLLERQIMIENVSSYLSFNYSTLSEWKFLQIIAEEADCLILLDINNIFVSAKNNHFQPEDYLQGLSTNRIAQYHLAGFEDYGKYLLDTHSNFLSAEVCDLFTRAIARFGKKPTVIEWDKKIPSFIYLEQEAEKAQTIMDQYVEFA